MCASVHLCARDITMSYYRLHKFLFSDQGNADEFLFYRTNWNDSRGITKLWTDNSSICSVEVPSTDSWPLSIWQVLQMSPPINTSIHQTYCVCKRLSIQTFFPVWSHVWTCPLWYFNLTCLQKYTQVQTHVHIAQGSLKITYCCIRRSVHASTGQHYNARTPKSDGQFTCQEVTRWAAGGRLVMNNNIMEITSGNL